MRKLIIIQDTEAAIFSTRSIRDIMLVPKGEYEVLAVNDGCYIGEMHATVQMDGKVVRLVVGTHWGETRIGKMIRES